MVRAKKIKMPPIGTVISSKTEVLGDVTFTSGMHIDGAVNGNVTGLPDTNTTLVISQSGQIHGDVKTENLILDGVIEGDVFAGNRVVLGAGAKVTGTVYYQFLEMAMGAQVTGHLIHGDNVVQEQSPQINEISEAEEQ